MTRTPEFCSTRRPLEVTITITIKPTGPLSESAMKRVVSDEKFRDLVTRHTKISMRAGGERDHQHISVVMEEAMLACVKQQRHRTSAQR